MLISKCKAMNIANSCLLRLMTTTTIGPGHNHHPLRDHWWDHHQQDQRQGHRRRRRRRRHRHRHLGDPLLNLRHRPGRMLCKIEMNDHFLHNNRALKERAQKKLPFSGSKHV